MNTTTPAAAPTAKLGRSSARITVRTLATGGAAHAAQWPTLIADYTRTLDDAELAQASRFAFDADRHDYIAAHGLRRQMLGRHLGLAPERLRFTIDEPRGKPRLAWPEGVGISTGIDFNISHTRGLVACALISDAIGAQIGVDCESVSRLIDDDLAAVFCNADEMAALRNEPADARIGVWVMKEALVKASGRGFELDLKSVNVALRPARVLGVPLGMGAAADWRAEHWRPTSSHIAALAWRTADGSIPLVEHGHGLE